MTDMLSKLEREEQHNLLKNVVLHHSQVDIFIQTEQDINHYTNRNKMDLCNSLIHTLSVLSMYKKMTNGGPMPEKFRLTHFQRELYCCK